MNNRDNGPNPRIATLHCVTVNAPDSQECPTCYSNGKLHKNRFWRIAMDTIKAVIGNLFGSVVGITFMLVGTLGWAYWMWLAIKLGSFGMFFFGILGPFAMVAGVLGLWSFVFGIPHWLQ